MPKVMEILLELTFPSDWIKVVVMQPHVHLIAPEPFKWPRDKKTEQITGIIRTLEIAMEQKAHFTLFPEYSIPGLEGVNEINEIISDGTWPNKTIIIGVVDGLHKNEYQQLCVPPNTNYHPDNGPDHVGQTEWVNCSVTWVKDNSGSVTRYIQPKICPAWPEKRIQWASMFCGKAICLFNAKYENDHPFCFISLICFDWIGKIVGSDVKVVDSFLQSMNEAFAGNPQDLHWIFVLQENDDPNNELFIRRTSDFLTQISDHPMVNRQNSTIVFINNSTKTYDGNIVTSNRAFTSCVFPTNAPFDTEGCPPTFSFASQKLRGIKINRCKDTIFRELQPCIHSFKVRVARFLDLQQVDRCHPIENAFVYPLDENTDDPRFPAGPVPACVKWVNDKLDNIESVEERNRGVLPDETKTSHEAIKIKLRALPANKQQNNIHYATTYHSSSEYNKDWTNIDDWDQNENDSLKLLLHVTTICGIADNTIDFANSELHARITICTV